MKKHKHGGIAHKVAKHASQGGGNLKLKSSGQTVHVAPKKDRMAQNVANHMGARDQMGPAQAEMESGGRKAAHKIHGKY